MPLNTASLLLFLCVTSGSAGWFFKTPGPDEDALRKQWVSTQAVALKWTAFTLEQVPCCDKDWEKDEYTGESSLSACKKAKYHGLLTCDSVTDSSGWPEVLPCFSKVGESGHCMGRVGQPKMRVVADSDEAKRFMSGCPKGRCGDWQEASANVEDQMAFFLSSNGLVVEQGSAFFNDPGVWIVKKNGETYSAPKQFISAGRSPLEATTAARTFVARGWKIYITGNLNAWLVGTAPDSPVAKGRTEVDATLAGLKAASESASGTIPR